MTEEARNIYLFEESGSSFRYVKYDTTRSIPSSGYPDLGYGRGRPVEASGKRLVFVFADVKNESQKKRFCSHDIIRGDPGSFLFFNDRLLDEFSHLIGKDINVLSAELYTLNDTLEGYHLIDIPYIVSGADKGRSTYWDSKNGVRYLDKLVPKSEYFMEGHEIAREKEMKDYVYIVPELREKLIKGKFKKLWMPTTKEYWEWHHDVEKAPY